MRTYPAFCSLNQPELESLSMTIQAPVDQAINLYPIFDEITRDESLVVTLQQSLSDTVPHYSNIASSLAEDLSSVTQQNMSRGRSSSQSRKTFFPASGESSTPARETVSSEGSYAPTHELTGTVRSRRAQPRAIHACDECRSKKKKCSGDQPLCSSCKKAGRVCTWTPMKTSRNRPCLGNYSVAKSCQPPSYSSRRNSTTRQLYIAAPKPRYPIKLQDMQGKATLTSAVQNPQAASLPLGVGFPAQIATRRTRVVDFDWSDFGSSDFSQEWIPLPPTCPSYFGNVLSPVHPLHARQQLRHEDIYRRALACQ